MGRLPKSAVRAGLVMAVIASSATAEERFDRAEEVGLPPEKPPASAAGDQAAPAGSSAEKKDKTIADEVPSVAYAHSAFGSTAGTFGAAGFGEGTGTYDRTERPTLGGGLRLFGSPIERLTLFGDVGRRDSGEYAPAAGLQLRILGGRDQHWALGLLGRYKSDAFAELEGESEFGVLMSHATDRLHLDFNAIVGAGFEEKESDGEILARFGYDALGFLRVGAEGRARRRLSGSAKLPGGRDYDAFGGPQVVAHYDHFFGALTAGPSNVGIADEVGWLVVVTAGGARF